MEIVDKNKSHFHLQTLNGKSVRSFEKKKDKPLFGGAKVFGVPLESLPTRHIPEFGLVPW